MENVMPDQQESVRLSSGWCIALCTVCCVLGCNHCSPVAMFHLLVMVVRKNPCELCDPIEIHASTSEENRRLCLSDGFQPQRPQWSGRGCEQRLQTSSRGRGRQRRRMQHRTRPADSHMIMRLQCVANGIGTLLCRDQAQGGKRIRINDHVCCRCNDMRGSSHLSYIALLITHTCVAAEGCVSSFRFLI
jgi:hypothetical protein